MSKIVLTLDSHALSQFQDCRRKFQLATIRSLEPKKAHAALSKGTLFHSILAEYYNGIKENQNRVELIQQIFTKIINSTDTEFTTDELLAIGKKFIDYTLQYKNDWEPIRIEGFQHTGFAKILYEDAKVKFIYEGRIDLLVRIAGEFDRWVDFKTQNPKYSYDRHPNVNQFIGYSWASGLPGIIAYVTWSDKTSDKTFRRQDINFTPQFIEKWKQSTIKWYFQILKTIQTQDYEYNFSACDTKYGPCQFHKICPSTNQRAEEYIIKNEFQKRERWKAW